MPKKIKLLILASGLCLVATPFLYTGGKSGSAGLITLGFLIFAFGMFMAPVLHLALKKPASAPPPPKEPSSS